MTKMWIVFVVCVLTFLAGIGLGYKLFSGQTKVIEKNRPPIYLHDSSIVIRRVSDTVLVPMAKVPGTDKLHSGVITIIPTGSDTVTDTIRLGGDTVQIIKTVGCDTIQLTYAILKEKDGGLRVQIKAKGGNIIDAIDVSEQKLTIPKQRNNELCAFGNFAPQDGTTNVGMMYNRTVGAFVVGGQLGTTINNYDNIKVGLQAGIRF